MGLKKRKVNQIALRVTDEELVKLKSIDENVSEAVRKCIKEYKKNVDIN